MKENSDSVQAAMARWQKREQMLSKGFTASRDFQRAKLVYYEDVLAKTGRPKTEEEKAWLGIARAERRYMEKKLYPNLLVRLMRRGVQLAVRAIIERRDNIRVTNSTDELVRRSSELGFNLPAEKIRQQLQQEKEIFKVQLPSAYTSHDQRMEQELSFRKGQNGYSPDTYTLTLTGQDGKKIRQTFEMSGQNAIQPSQAQKLLLGRAVEVNGKWIQLDLNDQDAKGNYHRKTFHENYGYDLSEALKHIPARELSDPMQRKFAMKALADGERVAVTLSRNGKQQQVYLEANPQFKAVNLYDEKGNKTSLANALGKEVKRSMGKVRELGQQVKSTRKAGVSVG